MSSKKPATKKEIAVRYRIKDISLVNRDYNVPDEFDSELKEKIKFSIKASVADNKAESIFGITIHYELLWDNNLVFKLDVRTDYEFTIGYVSPKDLTLFKSLLLIAIHHTRGIQAITELDSKMKDYLIPQVDPAKFTPKEIQD